MKPLPIAIIVILIWTVLVIVDNWPQERSVPGAPPEPAVVTASNQPPSPPLQMVEQPRYRPGR
jgi:hypothetical protein